jgi:hypothetical protein
MKSHLLEYAEVDLDLYRITRFETAQHLVAVPNWTFSWNSSYTFEGVANANLPSGLGGRFIKSTGNPTLLRWTFPPSLQDLSTVIMFRPQVMPRTLGLIARGSGGDGTHTGYLARLTGTTIELGKLVSAVFTSFATVDFSVSAFENVWLRFDAINITGPGVLLRAKAWKGVLSDEPSLFSIFHEDLTSPLTSSGLHGIFGSTSSGSVDQIIGHYRARSMFGSTIETSRFVQGGADYAYPAVEAIPSLEAISVSAAVLSLGEDLGQRATVNVQLRDHRGADSGELFNSGMFWSKFRARNLFRRGQPLRVVRKTLENDIPAETRHYVLDSFNGPTPDGKFTFQAKDILKFADNDRAQAPRINDGFLSATLTVGGTSATLLPTGVGNLQYSASGYVNIGGKEIAAFTRSGDVLTLTRAQFGTVAVEHAAEDRVQECLHINGEDPAFIANLLLTSYADVNSSYIPLSEWQTEVDTYLARLYTRLIPEPLGVNRLLSELITEAGLVMWEDSKEKKIRLKVLRGIPTNAFEYNEDNIMSGSINVSEQRDRLITQSWTYYGVRNPLESDEERNNFRGSLATINEEEESNNGSAVIKKIFAKWIPSFAEDTAQRLNDLVLGRFSIPPRKVSFSVLRNSGVNEPREGEGYRFRYSGARDEAGDSVNIPIQVVSVNPMPDRWQVTAEEMLFKQFDPQDLIDRVITVTSNTLNFNLRQVHDSIYPELTDQDVLDGVNLTVIVNDGAIIGSSVADPDTPSFHAGESADWPVGFPITLKLNGRIQGKGGDGGDRTGDMDGQPGCLALYTRFALDVEYGVNAEIWSGAGGGGASVACGGGGGAGLTPGTGGEKYPDTPPSGVGQPGTTEAGGAGGTDPDGPDGGDGGGPGLDGQDGELFFIVGTGGVAGVAIDGVSFLNVVSGTVDVRGSTIN